MTAIAVTIAGSDSGGGAGIQADLKTFSALGVYGASVITALTAQNTVGVQGIHDVPPAFIQAQMLSVFSDLKVNALKIGMLSQPDVIRVVAASLPPLPMVLDPVMVAASGDKLLADEAVSVLREILIPKALIITPNLPETAVLLQGKIATNDDEMVAQGKALILMGAKAVLMKGGHASGETSNDYLITASKIMKFSAVRVETNNSHGTGCTLSSAITAGLAKGLALEEAVSAAKTYVTEAIKASNTLHIGAGKGPTHHFYGWW
jgi:hydroxymethylpyrimidine/phosphomethylpyrimidine kinase